MYLTLNTSLLTSLWKEHCAYVSWTTLPASNGPECSKCFFFLLFYCMCTYASNSSMPPHTQISIQLFLSTFFTAAPISCLHCVLSFLNYIELWSFSMQGHYVHIHFSFAYRESTKQSQQHAWCKHSTHLKGNYSDLLFGLPCLCLPKMGHTLTQTHTHTHTQNFSLPQDKVSGNNQQDHPRILQDDTNGQCSFNKCVFSVLVC